MPILLVSLGFTKPNSILPQQGDWFPYDMSSLFQGDVLHACTQFKRFERTSVPGGSNLRCPVVTTRVPLQTPKYSSPEKHVTAGPTERTAVPSCGHSWLGALQGQQHGSHSVCPKALLPALALAEVPQDMVRRRRPCCPRRCRQARDRGREGGTTDLSFIPDCSMAEAHESVKPKSINTVPDISDIQTCEKLSDQLHPGACSPGCLSVRWFMDTGWGISGTSSLACPWAG